MCDSNRRQPLVPGQSAAQTPPASRSRRLGALPSWVASPWLVPIASGIAALLFLAVRVPLTASKSLMSWIDLYWVNEAVNNLALNHHSMRPLAKTSLAPFAGIAGLDGGAWVWCLLTYHVLAAALVFGLCRAVGLATRGALTGAAVFLAIPGATGVLNPSQLLEVILTICYLTVCLAYIHRAQTKRLHMMPIWLLIEAAAVVIGVGHKESFVIYPLLLVGLEVVALPRRPGRSLLRHGAAIALRIGPHVALALAALSFLGDAFSSHSFSPVYDAPHALGRLGLLAGTFFAPLASGWTAGMVFLGLLGLGACVAVCLARPDRARPVALGLMFALFVALPMLLRPQIIYAGYAYQVWAGAALAVAAIPTLFPRTAVQLAFIVWLAALAASAPVLSEPRSDITEVVQELEATADEVCQSRRPVWRSQSSQFRTLVNQHSDDPNSPSSADFIIRIRCRHPKARAVLDR